VSDLYQIHTDGDCCPSTCPMCIEEQAHEDTHDLTKERECRRCGRDDVGPDTISEADCFDEGLEVIARPGLETEKVYVNPDGSAFWTPDGVGCFFYDSEDEALAAAGSPDDWDVVHLDREFVQ
jgi:hypothetical protein